MINHNRLQLTKLAFALSMALAISTPVLAQNTTSAIGGRISTSSGAPAAGAQVTIVHLESGSVSKVVADSQGRYSARGLRVGGPYTVTITKDGVAEKFENVFLQLAETANVDATLGAPAVQTVTIAGRAAGSKFNTSSMGAGTSIGSKELAALSSIQRSLSDYARLDPRLSQTDKERGEISAGGQNARFNSITIDGVSISDTFGLEANGLPTNKQPISIDSIQSVQVNISNYDTTQKGYTGANINAVTKSGTNTWKGSVYQVYRDERMTGDRYNRIDDTYRDAPAFKERTTGFTLGGPLIKDTLFLFASAEDSKSQAAPVFGQIGSAANNVAITQSSIDELRKIAQATYGFDPGTTAQPGGPELKVNDRLLKVDWNVNDDHRVSVRWQKTSQADPVISGYSASGVGLSSQNYLEKKSIESSVVQWFADWTPSFSTEAKLSRRDSGRSYVNSMNLPAMSLQIGGTLPANAPAGSSTANRFINFGTERSRHYNELDTKTTDMYYGATWNHGAHEVKGGMDYSKNSMFNGFLQNNKGNYTFACQNTSSAITYTTPGLGSVNCQTSPQDIIEKAALENFARGRISNFTYQFPNPGTTLADTAARWELANTGLFLQDTWTVSPELKMTFGVRYDSYSTDQRPRKNAQVALPTVAGVYGPTNATLVRNTGGFGLDNQVTVDGEELAQPRFGFNFTPKFSRPTQLRGGVGLFGGAALNVWLGNPFANPGVAAITVGCGTLTFAACSGVGKFNPDPNNQSGTGTTAAQVDVLQNGLSQPSVWKANLGGEHELPWFGLVVGVEYLHTKVNTGLYYQSINLGAPTRKGPDARDLFWTAQGYKAECANGTGGFNTNNNANPALPQCAGFRNRALSNAAFTDVLQVTETKKGGGNLVSLSLANSKNKDMRWNVAYTYTDATEVSNLSSSTSGSNFGARAIFNPNEDIASNSAYLVKDRINASISWEKRFFGTYKTSFGAFYEGRTGKPYSWTFNNDMNGDGTGSNDLMYIPTAFGSGEVIFRGDTATDKGAEIRFWATVDAHQQLREAAGGVVERQSAFAPWTNSIDLRLSQEIPGLFKGNKGVFVLDFQNFGNMLNKRWGRINEVAFNSAGGNARSFVDYAGMQNGKYVYQVRDSVEDYVQKNGRSESQWAVQVTARYEF